MGFLPVCREDMTQRGWDVLDFLFISGDAYIDHPSFGAAILTRLLEDEGYRVGVIAQPDIMEPNCLQRMGRPLLGVFVSSGVVDSMVNNYTAAGKRRSDDRYAPGGVGGKRPDRALIQYCNLVRSQFGEIPLVIGGVEASLRRFAHYDVWSDKVRRSILQDSRADLLSYGMGESSVLEIARLLARGANIKTINNIAGTCLLSSADKMNNACRSWVEQHGAFQLNPDDHRLRTANNRTGCPENEQFVQLPSYEQCAESKTAYAVAFASQYREQDPKHGRTLIQRHGTRFLIQNPPQKPLPQSKLDHVYSLPYERTFHPSYLAAGGVPAIEEVRFSVSSHRGCFGGCNFCAIGFHQGRIIQHRSDESVLAEVEAITRMPDFKGYIHDIGGPTANFHEPACEKQRNGEVCRHRQCLFPKPCPALNVSHKSYLELLRKARQMQGVKKVFIRSGIRYDYLLMDRDRTFFRELCQYHISGQLKVAPEHTSDAALQSMGKPEFPVYEAFRKEYETINQKTGLKQYLVPYLISGHPGCTLRDAIELALYIQRNKVMPEQVQDFYPTPGTVSTTMYYTGIHPFTMQPIHVPDKAEKRMQRALLQFGRPQNRSMVIQALKQCDRMDLIGYEPNCLIQPQQRPDKENGAIRHETRNTTGRKVAAASRRAGSKKTAPDRTEDRTHTRISDQSANRKPRRKTVGKDRPNSTSQRRRSAGSTRDGGPVSKRKRG